MLPLPPALPSLLVSLSLHDWTALCWAIPLCICQRQSLVLHVAGHVDECPALWQVQRTCSESQIQCQQQNQSQKAKKPNPNNQTPRLKFLTNSKLFSFWLLLFLLLHVACLLVGSLAVALISWRSRDGVELVWLGPVLSGCQTMRHGTAHEESLLLLLLLC